MIYDLICSLYDKVNESVDYKAWADFIEHMLRENMDITPTLGLDLGAGTGKMTVELGLRGYDMTGVDYSPEMLCVARERAEAAGLSDKILWLCQDISEFELYGTVDFAVCCLDTVNHLTEPYKLRRFLSLVHNYLVPGGLFVFDINCRGKFERTYADNAYVIEEGEDVLIWQNSYNQKRRLCDFYITLFSKTELGYEREDEVQSERVYTLSGMKRELSAAGFELVGVFSDFQKTEATDNGDRAYFVVKCKK